jgi:hypothetical protein
MLKYYSVHVPQLAAEASLGLQNAQLSNERKDLYGTGVS